MNVDRALVFKSIDAKKQNPQNRPGKFTVKFFPELFLENNKQHFLALDHLSMTASWHNIRPEYGQQQTGDFKRWRKKLGNNHISSRNF